MVAPEAQAHNAITQEAFNNSNNYRHQKEEEDDDEQEEGGGEEEEEQGQKKKRGRVESGGGPKQKQKQNQNQNQGEEKEKEKEKGRWPGWPGETVLRMVVPLVKVGTIIGRKGQLIKNMCDETKARVRILNGLPGTTERVVMVNAREDPEATISPAMDAILRVHKRVAGIFGDDAENSRPSGLISTRLLAPQLQASSIIGKQGATIKSIQDASGATVRILAADGLSFCALSDDRIVEIQGEPLKAHKALELVIGHLRKFLVDRSILPLFEKSNQTVNETQELQSAAWGKSSMSSLSSSSQNAIGTAISSSYKVDTRYLSSDISIESQSHHRGLSMYGKDPGSINVKSSLSAPVPAHAPMITQIIQQLQIPLSYADDVIGTDGMNINYMRRISGASITVQETRGVPGEITVEIKGSESQVQTAQQFIQDFISRGHKKTHSNADTKYGSYTQSSSSYYGSSALSSHSLGGYRSSYSTGYGSGYGY